MPHPWLTFPRRRPVAALAIYWFLALVVTHVPPFREHDPTRPPGLPLDKLVHFGGYAALTWLLMNALTSKPTRRLGVAVVITVAVVAAYGIFDELTQPPFGRTADVWDYYADLVGLAFGLGLFLVTRAGATSGKLRADG